MRKSLVLTSAYARLSVHLCGEGEGGPKATRGEENAIFSWQELRRCFWETSFCLEGKLHDYRRFQKKKKEKKRGFFKSLTLFSKTIVKWKEKVQNNTKLSLLVAGEMPKLRNLPSRTSSLLCSAANLAGTSCVFAVIWQRSRCRSIDVASRMKDTSKGIKVHSR